MIRCLNFSKYLTACLLAASCLVGISDFVLSEETYVFERMWPTLQQPWYFYQPEAIAVNRDGYIFVVDTWHNRIVKLTPTGKVVKSAGVKGSEPGNFDFPGGITIDQEGFIYVAERNNQRIQKFNADLELVEAWPSAVTPNMMGQPEGGLAIDSQGYIYHTDYHDNHIYKYRSDGKLVQQWGSSGNGPGQFNRPIDIAIDQEGYLYITDWLNHRVQKFTSDGEYLDEWGGFGSDPGEFYQPKGITIDSEGYLYVSDSGNSRVQKFNRAGDYITEWGTDVEIYEGGPAGIAVTDQGILYVTTQRSVTVFTTEGVFLERWSSRGVGPAEFGWPDGVANDNEGYVYVTDSLNNKILKFAPNGEYVGDWHVISPSKIKIINSIVYLSQTWNKMSTYTTNGNFIKEWEVPELVYGFDVDSKGNIYAAVQDKSETEDVAGIVKYNTNGEILAEDMTADWGPDVAIDNNTGVVFVPFRGGIKKYDEYLNLIETYVSETGEGNGQFMQPESIAVDNAGNIYVSDTIRNDIQKFSSNGLYLTTIGKAGTEAGSFSFSREISVDKAGTFILRNSAIHAYRSLKKLINFQIIGLLLSQEVALTTVTTSGTPPR